MLDATPCDAPALTAGTLLDGRVAYCQPRVGYRTGIEPVLLAACVPAWPGQRVVEAGTGAGAGLLCLAARVGRLDGLGIERDPAMATLATANVAANGGGLRILAVDLGAWQPDGEYHHVLANPPWHDAQSTPSPQPGRRQAKVAPPGTLQGWVQAMVGGLCRRGTLSLVIQAARLSEAMVALAAARCGEAAILPLWPHAGQPARLVLLQGVRDSRAPARMLPGLVLHEADGSYTSAVQAVLRGGAALDMR